MCSCEVSACNYKQCIEHTGGGKGLRESQTRKLPLTICSNHNRHRRQAAMDQFTTAMQEGQSLHNMINTMLNLQLGQRFVIDLQTVMMVWHQVVCKCGWRARVGRMAMGQCVQEDCAEAHAVMRRVRVYAELSMSALIWHQYATVPIHCGALFNLYNEHAVVIHCCTTWPSCNTQACERKRQRKNTTC